MPTPGADLSRLNLTQLCVLTGRDRRWLTQRLAEAQVAPCETTARERYYPARLSLEAVYMVDPEALDLTAERARLSFEQADAQALKNTIARGEQVRGDEVDLFLLALVGGFTQRIRAIPPKAAPEVRATGSDAECEALLTTFHDEALDELAGAARAAADRVARRDAGEVVPFVGGARAGAADAAPSDGERVGGSGAEAEPGVERGAGAVEDGAG